MAYLASDNISGVCPEILEALAKANVGYAKSYGADEWSKKLTAAFRELFEHDDLAIFPVFNGSAANCSALASLMRPYEAVLAHEHSHIEQDECGMPEFFTGGKVIGVSGENGKIQASDCREATVRAKAMGVHHVRPRLISITQATEFGTVYRVNEISAIATLAKNEGLYLHMDGARFANAVVSVGCKPADLTWRAGVDVISFGATKNGAMLAEAVIFFRPELAADFGYIRKRAGQLASKQRFISAQLLAMLENNLWLKNATHANLSAKNLANGLKNISGVKILNSVEANELFVELPKRLADGLLSKEHYFYNWPLLGADIYRLVTSFQTSAEDIEEFVADCRGQA